ncbi:hypothetical protein MetMK1DRAFT_00029530 [Metallosphaera yellowstonensis MK1]|jgi:hypothetical protein|uniref:Uncharacterized protein n=1 Tax=Metallosphaera yellowstonensis MK1 TaxID=671065 RepID=H2C8N8_9CREN|nr:hypothetical protein MetMK1DRAFT_00029530 [Metallosphaera yellowstonensis MK1]
MEIKYKLFPLRPDSSPTTYFILLSPEGLPRYAIREAQLDCLAIRALRDYGLTAVVGLS